MLCPTCGANNPDDALTCTSCGSSMTAAPAGTEPPPGDAVPLSPALPPGVKLQNGAFAIGPVMGQGGFGITYKGGDMQLRRYVAIKEFFPPGSERSGQTVQPTGATTPEDYQAVKEKFLEEARALARFNHPGIVRVFSTFEENNTAYMVMEFVKGQTLEQILQEKGSLPENEAIEYGEKIGEALSEVHAASLIHRDIKPENILVGPDGRVILLDFGTARALAMGKTVRQTAMLTPGYAPLEQYGEQARFGVPSDIYSLGATLYRCLTGTLPPQATDRAMGVQATPVDQVNPFIRREVSDAIMWALQVKADQRPQSMAEFLGALRGEAPAHSVALEDEPADAAAISALPTVAADPDSPWKISTQTDTDSSPAATPKPAPAPTVVVPPTPPATAPTAWEQAPVQPPQWQTPQSSQQSQFPPAPYPPQGDSGQYPQQQYPPAAYPQQQYPPQQYPPQQYPPQGQYPQQYPPPAGQPYQQQQMAYPPQQEPPIPAPHGYQQRWKPKRYVEKKGNTVLTLGIIGLCCCQFAAPAAWVQGNNALAEYGDEDPGDRGLVQTGRILGMIGTGILALSVILRVIAAIVGAGS